MREQALLERRPGVIPVADHEKRFGHAVSSLPISSGWLDSAVSWQSMRFSTLMISLRRFTAYQCA